MRPDVLIWVVVSSVGLVLGLYLLHETRKDLGVLPREVNGRRLAATSRLLREGIRVSVHAAYLWAGLAVLDLIPGRAFVVPILIWGNVALVINSLIDARTRYLIYQTRDREPPFSR